MLDDSALALTSFAVMDMDCWHILSVERTNCASRDLDILCQVFCISRRLQVNRKSLQLMEVQCAASKALTLTSSGKAFEDRSRLHYVSFQPDRMLEIQQAQDGSDCISTRDMIVTHHEKRIDTDSNYQCSVPQCISLEKIPYSVYRYQLFASHEERRDHEMIVLHPSVP